MSLRAMVARLILVGLALFAVTGLEAQNLVRRPREAVRRVLLPFDYRGVSLDDGLLRRQFDAARAYYLAVPNDDLLIGFRKRAGKPAPGRELGGWYSEDGFHCFGQILSGLARMYAATGDPDCKAKAESLMHGWGECIAPDGYFFYSRKPNAPHYIYDKMVGGLVDIYLYCGDREALGYLDRITDWADTHLDRANVYAFNWVEGPTEWYTLSENLYRAYLATGSDRYRRFAGVWEYTEYWDLFAQKVDIFGPRKGGKRTDSYHAYSHVNTLGGAGAAYLVKGEPHYLATLRNAYDFLQSSQCYATGGYGPNEALLPRPAWLRALAESHNSFETQCGAWAAFKLCKYLLSLTGDAKYGDWVERLALNGTGITPPISPDGRVLYYSDYNLYGATLRNYPRGWSCCAGTRPMDAADVFDLAYFHTDRALCVNLYTPSTVRWMGPEGEVVVEQQTRFPESDQVNFVVRPSRPTILSLRFRSPGWLAGPMQVAVNGRVLDAKKDPQGWVTVRRSWSAGDRVELTLPMRLTADPIAPGKTTPAAVRYGPVVLAFRAGAQNPGNKVAVNDLAQALEPIPGEALAYRVKAAPDVTARPLYAYREGDDYFVYLDPEAASRTSHYLLHYSDGWHDSGAYHFSNQVGATVEQTFEGTGIRWLGSRYNDAGKAEVSIDGTVVAVVDQFGPGRDLPFTWSYEGLAPGSHALRLRILPEKNPASANTFLNIAGLEYLGVP